MADDEQQIKAALDEWERIYNAGDCDNIAKCYAEDAVLLPLTGPRLEDRAQFGAAVKGLRDAGHVRSKVETVELEVIGEIAWVCNKVTLFNAEDQPTQRWKTLEVWKKIKGEWVLFRDSFSEVKEE